MKIDLIKRLAMGAFVGCFIGLLVAVFISLQAGPQNINFSGTDIINLFFGCIVAGWGFSLDADNIGNWSNNNLDFNCLCICGNILVWFLYLLLFART